MRIVYTCYGGTHSSPVAAAVHLGQLPRDRIPSPSELLSLLLFDRTTSRQHGTIRPMGTDRLGHSIYVLGRGQGGESIIRAVRSGIQLSGGQDDDVLFVNTLVAVNLWMRIGGFLSRALGWVKLGRPLVIYGTRRAFPNLVRLVEAVESRLT